MVPRSYLLNINQMLAFSGKVKVDSSNVRNKLNTPWKSLGIVLSTTSSHQTSNFPPLGLRIVVGYFTLSLSLIKKAVKTKIEVT